MSGIHVEIEAGKIWLTGWIGPETPEMCKRVGSGRFAKVPTAHWVYPLDLGTCRRFRTVFGQRLTIGPRLNRWAREAIEAETALLELSKATDATLYHVGGDAPRIAAAMGTRSYQRVATAFGARVGSFLLADQPGLGKTIETLGTIVESSEGVPGVHLILCPSVAVRSVWAAEVAQWLGDSAVAFPLTGTREQRQEALTAALAFAGEQSEHGPSAKHTFIVGNIEMARIVPTNDPKTGKKTVFKAINAVYPDLHKVRWSTVVVDESHRALIRTSGQSTQQRAGLVSIGKLADSRIALSGTPMRGKPSQLWGTLNWLRPDIFTSYWNWVGRYWELHSDGFSDFVLGEFKSGADDALARDLAPFMLRRTKGEVLSELPPKQYAGTYLIPDDEYSPHGVWLEMTPAQRKQYDKLMRDGVIVGADGEELFANGVLPQDMRRKQLCGAAATVRDGVFGYVIKRGTAATPGNSAKFDWLLSKLAELGIAGDGAEGDARIVVASQFTSLLEAFATALSDAGIATHMITGNIAMARRDAAIADFQSDSPSARVFLINTQAAGVAVTLDRADDLVLLDETWVPDDQEQVEDRIHRASRMHNVTIHYLRMLDTIEEEIAWITAAREDAQKYILDGARGVSYARQRYVESRKAA